MKRYLPYILDICSRDRDPGQLVALSSTGLEPVSWRRFLENVAALVEVISGESHEKWGLHCHDTYWFVVGFVSLLYSGKRVVLPPNERDGSVSELASCVDALLVDAACEAAHIPTFSPEQPRDEQTIVCRRALAPGPQIELFTSGTTGQGKRVVKHLEQIDAELNVLESRWGRSLDGTTVFATVTHQHIYGLLFRALWPLCAGRPFYRETFSFPEALLSSMGTSDRTSLVSSPALLRRMPQMVELGRLRGRCQAVFSSGGPLPAAAAETIARTIGHAPIEVLGSTETGGVAWRQQDTSNLGALWTPLDSVEIRCGSREQALEVRSPFAEPGGRHWVSTGDRVSLRPDGTFSLEGRADRIVKIEETRVSLPEVETRLVEQSHVADCSVVVVPRDHKGDRDVLGAAVVLSASGRALLESGGRRTLSDALNASLAHHLELVTLPKRWRFVERIPENAQGKRTAALVRGLFAQAADERPRAAEGPDEPLRVGDRSWRVQDVIDVAEGRVRVGLSESESWRKRIRAGSDFLNRVWRERGMVYGVNTGYGDSCDKSVPPELVEQLPANLIRFHGCGMGDPLDLGMARAALAVRLVSLGLGYSGVRLELLERLCLLLNRDIVPVMPREGSVGASGDLTPLSYLGAVVLGEREVFYQGRRLPTREVYEIEGIERLSLLPKEGLAIMNGTSVMTGIACHAFHRAEYLARLSSRITAMAVTSLRGNRVHFDRRLFEVKPHPGQQEVAAWIRRDLRGTRGSESEGKGRLQDRYSLRCAPHVIGVLADILPWIKRVLEIEINSANDNPIIDAENEQVLHGGHFYGGHIAFSMDALKNAVANIADLLDRQMAMLVDPKANQGLPPNLSGARGSRASINHGFKALQIAVSAWTAEALKLSMPASVFSRSTECHNQDKVSLGTISARDCIRILELAEQVAAALLLAVTQGIALREREGDLTLEQLSSSLRKTYDSVGAFFPFLDEDRPLEATLRHTVSLIRDRHWPLYPRNGPPSPWESSMNVW